MNKYILSVIFLLPTVSCKEKAASVAPPPVQDGRCLVARYINMDASDQTCVFKGYQWHCVMDSLVPDHHIICDRGPEFAEVTK